MVQLQPDPQLKRANRELPKKGANPNYLTWHKQTTSMSNLPTPPLPEEHYAPPPSPKTASLYPKVPASVRTHSEAVAAGR